MTVEAGQAAPAFELAGDGGEKIRLGALLGQKAVVYFYPKDDTSGCTSEAIDFTSKLGEFASADTVVIGVSKDSVASHAKFRAKHNLGVKLAADPDGSVVAGWGVWIEKSMYGRKYMGIERATFLIGRDGNVARVWHKVKVPGHAAEVLKAAQDLG